ncbi:MAG: hypothetical protein AAF236_05560 [Verrucomicrobiota bacterium]
MFSSKLHLLLALGPALFTAANSGAGEANLVYSQPPPDNPLRGLVPYVESDGWDRFPNSLQFSYFSWRDLMTGPNQFNWTPIEKTLAITQSRGCQLTCRVVAEYPGKSSQIPQFLIDQDLHVTTWTREAELDGGICHTPDYEDPKLLQALLSFITAFGEKYDGDPRIGYITAGLLGSWGEWHTYPRSELMASKATQTLVLGAYAQHFEHTPILVRYPAGPDHYALAPNHEHPVGFHDDSFAWATLETGDPEDDWFFLPGMRLAGTLERWKRHPIGGEIRPELWPSSFTETWHPQAQDFATCVRETHVTWLMDSGLFSAQYPLDQERTERAISAISDMGYELHLSKWRREGDQIEIVVENRGVAPFYQDWKAEVFVAEKLAAKFPLSGILPGDSVTWKLSDTSGGKVKLRTPNPMEGGKPLRFANAEQGEIWLQLPTISQ